jgi:hypothetical protein
MDEILNALAEPGPHLAAWRLGGEPGFESLAIYRVADDGTKELAVARMKASDKPAASALLAERGVNVGAFDLACDHVWRKDGGQLQAWSSKGLSFRFDEVRGVETGDGFAAPASDIAEVRVFISDNAVDRGVALVLKDGTRRVIASETSFSPTSDPTWSRNELLSETAWAAILARALARATGATYRDER